MLLVPCPICSVDVEVPLVADGAEFRAPDLLPNVNAHVIDVHDLGVSGT